ncbi:MAG TPA: adenylyl-sulfate kinase, partial [Vulgatibacter sp.]
METQQGFTLWLTGMSGAGKSALASYLARRLPLVGRRVELLDPTELGDLAPDPADAGREERDRTVRLLGWVARLLTRNGTVPVVAAVSPHRELRDEQRRQIGRFFEVMVECPFEILMERDTKGIYRRALAGELENVVGVQAPYEPPLLPEAVVDMASGDVEAAAAEIFEKLAAHGYVTRQERDILLNGSAPAPEPAKAGKGGKAKGKKAAGVKAAAPAIEASTATGKSAAAATGTGAKAKPAVAGKSSAPAAKSAKATQARPAAAGKTSTATAKGAKATPTKAAATAGKASAAPAKKAAAATTTASTARNATAGGPSAKASGGVKSVVPARKAAKAGASAAKAAKPAAKGA